MSDPNPHGSTTASVEAIPRLEIGSDPTPGMVLVYSQLHANLPSAVPFSSKRITLGRESDNNLSVAEGAVSRYHAEVTVKDNRAFIKDLGSTNGTSINGQPITGKVELREQDLIRIGDSIFRFVSRGIYAYSAYRPDGTIVASARPVTHNVNDSPLRGGFQVDRVIESIYKVARSELSVVVTGESGTGKELAAQELHRLSRRRGAFQAINCAAIPDNLLESELFGYKKGAFTGANADKKGIIAAAHEGTLFLDEIGDMPLDAQAKLLRVLQEKEVAPLGATKTEKVNVRVVCATHRDLEAHVIEGTFRGDLLARLREFTVQLPPLRNRREDLFPLLHHFLKVHGGEGRQVRFPYMLALASHTWPYNVRELQSAVRLSLTLAAPGQALDLLHLPPNVQQSLAAKSNVTGPNAAVSVPKTSKRKAPDKQELIDLLVVHNGNVAAVGRVFGKERMQVHRWMKRHGIDPKEYR